MIDRLAIKFLDFNNISINGMDLSTGEDFSVLSIFQMRDGTTVEQIRSYPVKTSVNFSLSNSNTKSFSQFLNRQLLAGTFISSLKGKHHGQM